MMSLCTLLLNAAVEIHLPNDMELDIVFSCGMRSLLESEFIFSPAIELELFFFFLNFFTFRFHITLL